VVSSEHGDKRKEDEVRIALNKYWKF